MLLARKTVPLLGLTALAALALTGKPAVAKTITFSGLTGDNGDKLSSPYTEGDFTVNFTSGIWRQAHKFGDSVPDIFTRSEDATIDVVHSGGTVFTFSSVDLRNASDGSPKYILTGLRSGETVFTTKDKFSRPDNFKTIGSPDSDALIDDLKITLKGGENATVNIDNIAVHSAVAAVPEPSSFASLGLGALGLGGLTLRARKRKVRSA